MTLPKDHCVQVPWKYIKVCGYSNFFCKNLKQRSLTSRWPLTPHLLKSHAHFMIMSSLSAHACAAYRRTHRYCVQLLASPDQMTLPKDHCVQVPWKYIKVCGYSDLFYKNLKQRSLTPSGYSNFFCKNLKQRSLTSRWPLTPHLLRSHVWLYPRIIVSKSHENTSKYVDTVTFFTKTWSKGHWPLGDLWPHICWGHMCDSKGGSLCPSPMKIHQSMWIQWPFMQKLEPKVSAP